MSDALRRELERWGFSDAEIDVYEAVLRTGEGPASEVGDRADVSRRHVYRICGRLEERGLVDVDDHVQPTLVRARPPSVVEEVLDRSTTTVAQEVESIFARTPEERTEMAVLKRQPTVIARARELLGEAERWAILVAPPALVETLADDLATAVDRGILVFLLTNVDSLSIDRPLGELATVVRTRDGPSGFQEVGLGVDKVRSLLVSPSAQAGDEHRHSPALYLDDDTIGPRSNGTLFGTEWRLGRERHVPDPVELPYTTAFFREALLHAALHVRRGTDIRARVEGRALPEGREATVEGSVAEVRQDYLEPYRQGFFGERVLVLDTGDGRATVGGPPATLEDYAAESVTLSDAAEHGES